MNWKKYLTTLVAVSVLSGAFVGGATAEEDPKALKVTVEAATGAKIEYYFVDTTPNEVNFGAASITGLGSVAPLEGSVTIYLVDARLIGLNTGFRLSVKVDSPFTETPTPPTDPLQFDASNASLVNIATPNLVDPETPLPLYPSSGSLTNVTTGTATGTLDQDRVVLTGANGVNVRLTQVLDLEVTVPVGQPAGVYTTTIVLTGFNNASGV